jgi:hypothetical protein
VAALDLSARQLRVASAVVIAKCIEVSSVLTSMDLSDNKLGAEGGMAIAGALHVNGALTSLDLSGNRLCGVWSDDPGAPQQGTYDAAGITAISDALRVNIVLTSLNLHWNEIGDEGAKAIAEAIKVNGALTALNLDGFALPIKQLKGTSPVLGRLRHLGRLSVASGIVIAKCIEVNP